MGEFRNLFHVVRHVDSMMDAIAIESIACENSRFLRVRTIVTFPQPGGL